MSVHFSSGETVQFSSVVDSGLRAGETPGDVVFREKRREDEIRRLTGWRFVRLAWADLAEPARTAGLIRAMMRDAA